LNGEFAKRFLMTEGITITSQSLGDERGRRVEYKPVTGQARQIFVDTVREEAAPIKIATTGSVELF